MTQDNSDETAANAADTTEVQAPTNETSIPPPPLTEEEKALLSLKKELNDQIEVLEKHLRHERSQLYDLRKNATVNDKTGYFMIQAEVRDFLVMSLSRSFSTSS